MAGKRRLEPEFLTATGTEGQLIEGEEPASRSPVPIHVAGGGLVGYFGSVQVPEAVEDLVQVTRVPQDVLDERVPLSTQVFPWAALKQNSRHQHP